MACVAAHAENHADVAAVDNRRRTAAADERERLSRHGEESDSHHHVQNGLRDEQQREPHGKEGREVSLTSTRYSTRSEEQEDI